MITYGDGGRTGKETVATCHGIRLRKPTRRQELERSCCMTSPKFAYNSNRRQKTNCTCSQEHIMRRYPTFNDREKSD